MRTVLKENPAQLLVTAVVDRAVTDWRKAVSQLADNPEYPYARETREKVEDFAGERFAFLCEINPEFTPIQLKEVC